MGLLALAGLCVAFPAHAQMSLPGKFEVTDTGSASYTIPISVVPGTAGLEPKLSLQYDSRSGNGLLGVGWSLAGLPAITRCGRTIAQDGQVGGVGYDANDRFCLDGQRLVAISGTYGADGTEYRTERESFSRVISYGQAGSGPSHFRVWTKAGLVMEFGNSADSRIEAQGKTSVRVWALNKTSDTKSNYFTVSYTEDNANGEYRPDRIDYTGNAEADTPPTNSIRFVYETRPDIVPLYQAGSLIRTTQRMTKVQVWQGENSVHEHELSYQIGVATQRSRVGLIRKCSYLSSCHEVSFVWSGNDTPQYAAATVQAPAPSFEGFNVDTYGATFLIDANGDGRNDLLQVGNASNTAQTVSLNGSGNFVTLHKQPLNHAGFARLSYGPVQLGDINGDGLIDAVQISNDVNTGQTLVSNGDGSFRVAYTHPLNTPGFARASWGLPFMGDIDGDGRADIVQISNDTNTAQSLMPNGDGSYRVAYTQPVNALGFARLSWGDAFMGDVNGDGLADILQISRDTNTGQTLLSNGDGSYRLAYAHPMNAPGFARLSWGGVFVADVNGDGMADIIQIGHDVNVAQVLLSKGDGIFEVAFSQPLNAPPFGRLSWGNVLIADINGDGMSDVVQIGASSAEAHISLSNGDGTFRLLDTAVFQAANTGRYHVLDVDGDGRPDFLQISTASGGYSATLYRSLSERTPPDQLMKIIHISGAVTEIATTPLSELPVIYIKDHGTDACAYPCVDVQGPLYVVSEVKSSNGLGGEYRSTYRYAGAKSDQHGRGFLGFRQMTVKDEQTGVEQITTYRQDYPFTGLVASREKRLGTQLLNRSSNSYSSTDLGGTRRYPFLTTSLEESWELSGAALPAVTTAYQYDTYGNATDVSVSTGDGHGKTTANTYANDMTTWLLGRLQRSVVTSTTPGQ